jgi:hypothetical protein
MPKTLPSRLVTLKNCHGMAAQANSAVDKILAGLRVKKADDFLLHNWQVQTLNTTVMCMKHFRCKSLNPYRSKSFRRHIRFKERLFIAVVFRLETRGMLFEAGLAFHLHPPNHCSSGFALGFDYSRLFG